ncbi:MAG: transcription termination factor Rho [Candidatus Bruticola sp.]
MTNLTFDMLTCYNRSQLQDIIRDNKIKCPKLSRLKHEDLIGIILENQSKIDKELPEVAEVNKVRRGRRPQYSAEHKAIMIKNSSDDSGAAEGISESAEIVYAEPVLPSIEETADNCTPIQSAETVSIRPSRRERNKQRQQQYLMRQRERYSDGQASFDLGDETESSLEGELRSTSRPRCNVNIPRVSMERQDNVQRQNRLAQAGGRRASDSRSNYDNIEDDSYTQRTSKQAYLDDSVYTRRELDTVYDSRRQSAYMSDNNYSRYDGAYYDDYDSEEAYDDYADEHEEYVPIVTGILDIRPQSFGFLRGCSYKPSANDVHVSSVTIKKYSLRVGDKICGIVKSTKRGERSYDLEKVISVNDLPVERASHRPSFDLMVPIFPNEWYRLETSDGDMTARMIDLFAPIGKGQRSLIVAPPKAGKTICLKKIADGISANHPDTILMALLVDERPEEVTDMQRSIKGDVVASTFDEEPENHAFITQLVLERARRLTELGKDVVILFDSLTRLGRACNNAVPNSGRTLSGGLDISALRTPKHFFGSARKFEQGGSLTIIATALIETGSRMDEVIFEEFKGTGNNEITLSRKMAERRIFPAMDIKKSGTRHEDCLQDAFTLTIMTSLRHTLDIRYAERDPNIAMVEALKKTANNQEFLGLLSKNKAKEAAVPNV